MPTVPHALPELAGVRVWWADGTCTARAFAPGETAVAIARWWGALPPAGVLVLVVYLRALREAWGPTSEQPPRLHTYNWRFVLEGATPKWDGAEYYWFDPVSGRFGAGSAADPARPAAAGVAKLGQAVPPDVWWPTYTAALTDEVAPAEVSL